MPTWYVNLSTGSDVSGGTTVATSFKTISRALTAAAVSGDTISITRGATGTQNLYVDLSGGNLLATTSNVSFNVSGVRKTITITSGFTSEAPLLTVAGAVSVGISGDSIIVINIKNMYVDLSLGSDPRPDNLISWANSGKTFNITPGASTTTGAYKTIAKALEGAAVSGTYIQIARGTTIGYQNLYVDLSGGQALPQTKNFIVNGITKNIKITSGYTVEAPLWTINDVAGAAKIGISGDIINVANIKTYYVNLSTGKDPTIGDKIDYLDVGSASNTGNLYSLTAGALIASPYKTISAAITAAPASGSTISIVRGLSGAQNLYVDLTTGSTTATILRTISGKSVTITAGFTVEAPVRTVASAVALGITGDTINVSGITTYNVDLSVGVDPISGDKISWSSGSKIFSITAGASITSGAYRTISKAIEAASNGNTISIVRGTVSASNAQNLFVNLTNGSASAQTKTISGKSVTITSGFTVEAPLLAIASAVSLGLTGDNIAVTGVTTLFHRSSGGSDAATVSWTNSSKTFTITNGVQSVTPYASMSALLAAASVGTLINTDAPPNSTSTADATSSYTALQVIDNAGTKTYNTIFKTVQAAVNATANGGTVNINAGSYTETVNISRGMSLIGADKNTTTITGVGVNGAININGFTPIGSVRIANLKIVSSDAPTGSENAAVFIGSINWSSATATSLTVEDNILEAKGESAFMVGANTNLSGALIVRNNIIQGKTFNAATVPNQTWTGFYFTSKVLLTSGVYVNNNTSGTSAQFYVPDMPKQMIVISGASVNSSFGGGVLFENNSINGATGGLMTGQVDTPENYRANTVFTCDADNSVIRNNTFNALCYPTSGNQTFALRVRGNNSTVTSNTFKDPAVYGPIYDNKSEDGTSATSQARFGFTVNTIKNTLVLNANRSSYSHSPSTTKFTSLTSLLPPPYPTVDFYRSGWTLTTGSSSRFIFGISKVQFNDSALCFVAAESNNSGSFTSQAEAAAAVDNATIDEIHLRDSSLLPAESTTLDLVHSDGGYVIYERNAEPTYAAASATEVVSLMRSSVKKDVPITPVYATKSLTGEYTERINATGEGVLVNNWYVKDAASLIALGIMPTQIIGSILVPSIPSSTNVDVSTLIGLPVGTALVTSTALNIPDSAAGQIDTKALSDAVSVGAGQQLTDAVGDNKVILAKPASDSATSIPVRVLPNDNSSTQVAAIEIPAGASQVAVEVKPNGVIATSGAITIKSPTSSPIRVIDLITGIAYTGTSIDINSGNFGSFTQPARLQVVSF